LAKTIAESGGNSQGKYRVELFPDFSRYRHVPFSPDFGGEALDEIPMSLHLKVGSAGDKELNSRPSGDMLIPEAKSPHKRFGLIKRLWFFD
jgi:hypothetical protein